MIINYFVFLYSSYDFFVCYDSSILTLPLANHHHGNHAAGKLLLW